MSREQAVPAVPNHLIKLLVELGPLFAFIAAWSVAGIFWATGVLMAASVVSLLVSWIFLGRVSPVVAATAVLVLVFGGLTLWFGDAAFIKRKPTVINLIFACVLIGGLWMKRLFLKSMLGEALNITEEGWRKLTIRWAIFFLALAALNEIVADFFSDAVWVNFKAYGILSLTLLFAMAQIGLIKRYEAKSDASPNL
jgi:intracellular septation protein